MCGRAMGYSIASILQHEKKSVPIYRGYGYLALSRVYAGCYTRFTVFNAFARFVSH
jgi:hypothetical protein